LEFQIRHRYEAKNKNLQITNTLAEIRRFEVNDLGTDT